MQRKRKKFDKIGLDEHKFDFRKEKKIYYNMYCLRGFDMGGISLTSDEEFMRFSDWKKYVIKKCENKELEKLIDFSHYLKQLLNEKGMSKELPTISFTAYFNLVIPAIIGGIIALYNSETIGFGLLARNITKYIIVFGVLCFLMQLALTFISKHEEKNFVLEYKMIIDELIESKKKEQSGK